MQIGDARYDRKNGVDYASGALFVRAHGGRDRGSGVDRELEYRRGEVNRDFGVHASERDELKRTLDVTRRLLARGRGPKPTARPSPRVGDSGGVLQP
jgi:hypothetical protein